MDFQTKTLTFLFLQQKFIHELKRQTQNRSKPSKAILQALKHSTNLNKDFKSQLQTLKHDYSIISKQNEFLKQMITNINEQVDYLKSFKDQKYKKLQQIQLELSSKIQVLHNQNTLLKTQIQILKHNSRIKGEIKNQDNQLENKINSLFNKQKSKNKLNIQSIYSQKYSPFKNQQNSKEFKQPCQSISKQLIQSARFNQYVNFEQKYKGVHQTRQNSKLLIQRADSFQREIKNTFQQENNNTNNQLQHENHQNLQISQDDPRNNSSKGPKNIYKRKNTQKSLNKQNQQTKILKNIFGFKTQQDEDQSQRNDYCSSQKLSSLQQLNPRIVQINSQQQIIIDSNQQFQTPTLPKSQFNPNQSNFLVFAKQNSTPKNNNLGLNYNKTDLEDRQSNNLRDLQFISQYTFLQIQTKKSIQDEYICKSKGKGISIKYNDQQNQHDSQCSNSSQQNHKQKQSLWFNSESMINRSEQVKKSCRTIQLLDVPEQFQMENVSGVDYQGLLNDIYGTQLQRSCEDKENIESGCIQNTQQNKYYNKLNQNQVLQSPHKLSSFAEPKSKRTSSELTFPQNPTLVNILKKNLNQQKQLQGSKPKDNDKVKIQIHAASTPVKYMNITQSYKTIDLDKVNRVQSSNQDSFKNIGVNMYQRSQKSQKQCDRIRLNSSSLMTKSKRQNNKMSASKIMMNSKLFSNVRANKTNKSQSPLSIENDIDCTKDMILQRRKQKRTSLLNNTSAFAYPKRQQWVQSETLSKNNSQRSGLNFQNKHFQTSFNDNSSECEKQ